jgi:hypothetical protein
MYMLIDINGVSLMFLTIKFATFFHVERNFTIELYYSFMVLLHFGIITLFFLPLTDTLKLNGSNQYTCIQVF